MIQVDIEVIHPQPVLERIGELVQEGATATVIVTVGVRATAEQMPQVARVLSELAEAGGRWQYPTPGRARGRTWTSD